MRSGVQQHGYKIREANEKAKLMRTNAHGYEEEPHGQAMKEKQF